jgi:hypothetical protein
MRMTCIRIVIWPFGQSLAVVLIGECQDANPVHVVVPMKNLCIVCEVVSNMPGTNSTFM